MYSHVNHASPEYKSISHELHKQLGRNSLVFRARIMSTNVVNPVIQTSTGLDLRSYRVVSVFFVPVFSLRQLG